MRYSNTWKEITTKTKEQHRDQKSAGKATTVLLSRETTPRGATEKASATKETVKTYCPYCNNSNHSLNNCTNFKRLTREQKESWIKEKNGCWRCGRDNRAKECNLKMRCRTCNSRQLLILHEVSERVAERMVKTQSPTTGNSLLLNTTDEVLYIGRPPVSQKVLL